MVWTLIISGMLIQAPHHTCVATRSSSKLSITNIKPTIFVADGQKIPTTGIGDNFIQSIKQDGNHHITKLCNVLYIHRLRGNLNSVKKLVDKGLEVHFEGKKYVVS